MSKAIFNGGLAFACGITCGAVAYAARDDANTVIAFVLFISLVLGFLSAFKEMP